MGEALMDTQAAKKRCEAASPGPWTPATILHLARKDDVEFAAHARSDLPAALEALEEAQGKIGRLEKLPLQFAVHGGDQCSAQPDAPCPTCLKIADLERQLAEAQGKLSAVELETHDWSNSERAWYCRMKIAAILSKEGE